jgi:hypothetical protein
MDALATMRLLLSNQPCTFENMIQGKAKERELNLTPEGVNMLDGLICQFVFVVAGTTQSLPRDVPSQKDYEYCLKIMGFGEYLSGPFGDFLSALIKTSGTSHPKQYLWSFSFC